MDFQNVGSLVIIVDADVRRMVNLILGQIGRSSLSSVPFEMPRRML